MTQWISRNSIIYQMVIPIFLILLVAGAASAWLTGFWVQKLVSEEIESDIGNSVRQVDFQLESLENNAANMAAAFSSLPEVLAAYKLDDEDKARHELYDYLRPVVEKFNSERGGDVFRIHFHKPSAKSFLRTWWRPGNNGAAMGGDDLGGFRATVKKVESSRKPVTGIEVGRGGLVIRALSPIMDGGRYLGSVEMFFSFNPVISRIKERENQDFSVFLLNEKAGLIAGSADRTRVGDFVEIGSTKNGHDYSAISGNDLRQGLGGLVWRKFRNKAVGVFPVKDFSGENIGVMAYELDTSLLDARSGEIRRNLLIGLMVITLLIAFVIWRLLKRIIVRPVQVVAGFAENIAADDSSAALPEYLAATEDLMDQGGVKNELRLMGASLNKMMQRLRENEKNNKAHLRSLQTILGEVGQVSGKLSLESDRINDSSQALSQGATQQAAALEQISASLSQISSQTRANAENASEADQLASNVRGDADQGAQQMSSMQQAMAEINQSSQEIAKIIKTIDEIAFQTNLLALNAAVEAARAGTHGKGFAVVAQEVRSLAGRSAKAAQETAELIDLNVHRVENGVEILGMTARSLNGIVDGASKMSGLIGEIAAADREQALGIAQISKALGEVETVTQQNTAFAEQNSLAAGNLAGQSERLRQTMITARGAAILDTAESAPLPVQKQTRRLPGAPRRGEGNWGRPDKPALLENRPSKTLFIEWSDSLSVGVRELDDQHKELVRLVNVLYEALKAGRGREALKDILGGLVRYTKVHFATEERFFNRLGYPEKDEHIQQHRKLVDQVLEFKKKVDSGQDMISVNLLDFLKDWLINHIQVSDKKYGPFLSRRGLS